jgi:hypothetical protein
MTTRAYSLKENREATAGLAHYIHEFFLKNISQECSYNGPIYFKSV